MNDELPDLFGDVAPRPAPADLRSGVLAVVGRELAGRRKPRWERLFELSAAASLALGVGLSAWVWRTEGARTAAHGEVILADRKLAASARQSATGATSRWHSTDLFDSERYQRLVRELSQGRIPKSL
jgi:hypothetical protein